HRFFAVDQVGVHVDVENVGAAFDLIARDLDGGVELAFLDEAFELERTGDIATLADHDEVGFGADDQHLVAAEIGPAGQVRNAARRDLGDLFIDGGDPFGGGAAA